MASIIVKGFPDGRLVVEGVDSKPVRGRRKKSKADRLLALYDAARERARRGLGFTPNLEVPKPKKRKRRRRHKATKTALPGRTATGRFKKTR